MMVVFTSRSEKKALYTVRRILDSFADRIGNDTWKTVITAEGLSAVRTLLRKSATKNTAVACHWIRSRSRSELVWVIGNRECFNDNGIVPVHSTRTNILHREWENGWTYLPLLKALVAVAALFHDYGKASDHFQQKLKSRSLERDPFRHEWMSCKLLEMIVKHAGSGVHESNDCKWLQILQNGELDICSIARMVASEQDGKINFNKLPPLAQSVCWLILCHHKLPDLADKEKCRSFKDVSKKEFNEMLNSIHADWGYENTQALNKDGCFTFSEGLVGPKQVQWHKAVKKWTYRLLENREAFLCLFNNKTNKNALGSSLTMPVYV